MLSNADHDRFVKLLGVLGSEFAGERDAAACAIERMRRKTGLTWAELLRPAPPRPRIIITPWPAMGPILARGEVPDWFEDNRESPGDAAAEAE